MASWTLRPTALDLHLNLKEAFKRHGGGQEKVLPTEDYYLNQVNPDVDPEVSQNDPYGVTWGQPVSRNIVEDADRLYIERNIYAHLNSSFQLPRTENNAYGDARIELEVLTTSPPSFIFLGKPGIGKSTLAVPLAKKLNSVLISPQTINDFYLAHGLPNGNDIVRGKDGGLSSRVTLALVLSRLSELDVLHRGYVMDGFPILGATDMTIEEQMKFIYSLPRKPDFIILLHMQDVDLYNRRRLQKHDPLTKIVYTMPQYMASELQAPTAALDDFSLLKPKLEVDEDEEETKDGGSRGSGSRSRSKSPSRSRSRTTVEQDPDVVETVEEEEKPKAEVELEFKPLDAKVLGRLRSRDQDRPEQIKKDFHNYKEALPLCQSFVDTFDSRKVLELSGYSLPSELYKKLGEFLTTFGVTPVPTPVKLIADTDPGRYDYLLGEDLDEFGEEEAPCIPFPEIDEPDPDWKVIERTCVIRGRADPRFQWRMTGWKNYCPVALKYGRSLVGKPQLAVGFLDKLYFLSSEEAFKQFELNPRPFLLPPMPTSPIKFYVIGHPLAGKTLFTNNLATYLGAYVIDMKRAIRRKFALVKHDYLFRVKLRAVFEVSREVDKQRRIEWKKLERNRREELLAWIESAARVDVVTVVERRLTITNAIEAARTHALGDTYSGICQTDDGLLGFSYKQFKENWRQKRIWPHQKKMELAWKLFNEGKLKYKRDKRLQRLARKHKMFYQDDKTEEGEGGEDAGEEVEVPGEEELGEGDAEPLRRHRKRRSRRRKFCKPKKEGEGFAEQDAESVISSVFGPEDEPDESIVLRYPELDFPLELIIPHPRPSNATEHDPLVTKLVEERMIEAEKYVDGMPPEIYLDILNRAISEVEPRYVEANPTGPLSGGWIVENLNPDFEQLKAIIRHPPTAPDHIVVLADNSENKMSLLNNLKRAYARTRVPKQLVVTPGPTCRFVPIYGQGDGVKRALEFQGEGGEDSFLDNYLARSREIIGEELICEDTGLELDQEVTPESPRLTESELLHSNLPPDTLLEPLELETSSSLQAQELRDKLRQVSLADSLLDVTQREILEAWLATFNIPESDQPPDSAVQEQSTAGSSKCIPLRCRSTYPVEGYAEIGWIPKRLNYELLTFPPKKFLAQRQRDLATRGSSPSIPDSGDDGSQPFEFEENFEELEAGEFSENMQRLDSAASLTAEEVSEDATGKPIYLPSLKGKFLNQIRHFDEVWNMLIPILNKEGISFSERGVVDEENVLDQVRDFWNSMENRFIPEAKIMTSTDLRLEYEEWVDANRLWNFAPDLNSEPQPMAEGDDESDGELEGEEMDELARHVNKPEEYRQMLLGIERMRHFGDARNFCPVTLKNLGLIRKGFTQFAAKYLDRTYFFASAEARQEFLEQPLQYLAMNERPLEAPCPRICVTGSPGCDQEEVALQLSKKYDLYYINFRQRLHELLKVQVGRNTGPGMPRSDKSARDLLGDNAEISEDVDKDKEMEGEEVKGEELRGEDAGMSKYDDLSLKNLGIMDPLYLAHCQPTEINMLESMVNRNWKEMSAMEDEIRNFLQYGRQLSDEILDVLLAMFWETEPFKSRGFIIVGFPNTGADIEFMHKRNYVPEIVFVLESKSKTMHNRLLHKTVDEWFSQHPGEKRKAKDNLHGKTRKVFIPMQHRLLTKEEKNQLMNEQVPLENDDNETLKGKDRLYKDTSVAAMISRNLLHWHRIYSKDLKSLKMALNEFRIEWTPIHTDANPIEAKRRFRELLENCFAHRESMFDSTYDLSLEEAEVLLNKKYFHHSKFEKMCPVEVYKGNRAVNLWHAPGVKKFPILYRGFVYFLAGVENANAFRLDPWRYTRSPPQTPVTPLYVLVLGHSKSGKTELCKRLEDKLGLVYISPEGMTQDIVQSSFLSQSQKDLESVALAAEGSSMLLADEVVAYLRAGIPIPEYIGFRILDFALMEPRAQYHGAVFDNYPLEDLQLQEMLERGVVPAVVAYLHIDAAEGYRRAELTRFNPQYNYRDPLPDSDDFMDYMAEDYEPLLKHNLGWYKDEIQCLFNVDGTQSPTAIFNLVRDRCYSTMSKVQRYIYAGLKGRPCPIEGLSPLTSLVRGLLSTDFGSFDPVALNDRDELLQVKDLTDLRKLVEFRGELYAFASDKNIEKFLTNPEAYTLPHCKRVPPKEVPYSCVLTDAEMLLLKESWGFMNYDPVVYVQGNFNSKWLHPGDPRYCVEYKSKFYFFTTPATMERFMKKPQQYAEVKLPGKLPGETDKKYLESDSLSPAGYLIASGLTNEVARMLDIVAKARPKFPFMSATKSSLLYLGYYLKTLNMKSSLALRTHYRKAMMHMIRTQGNARDIIHEVNKLHGKQYIPEDVQRRYNLFLGLADLPDKDRVLDPFIPGADFNLDYETLDIKKLDQLIYEPKGNTGAVLNSTPPPPYLNKTRLI